ncbi:MAG: DUF1428 domain-containing protein [Sphingomonadales bacterium]|nr:DUF1428 domain-containing protein [Sphingomonadales bacterium]
MTYIEGFVIAVPTAKRQAFIDHAREIDAIFIEHGALRVVECWGDDVPHGTVTDFHRAVAAREDETVGFAWIEWPDRATREREMARIREKMATDPRMDPITNPPPFDGKRMIFGGFEVVVDLENTKGE